MARQPVGRSLLQDVEQAADLPPGLRQGTVKAVPNDLHLGPCRLRPGRLGNPQTLFPASLGGTLGGNEREQRGHHHGPPVTHPGQRVARLLNPALHHLLVGRVQRGHSQGGVHTLEYARQLLRQLLHRGLGDLEAELPGRLFLQIVGLVDNQVVILGQQRSTHQEVR